MIRFSSPGLELSFTLVSSDWSGDIAQRFQALTPYRALRGSDRPDSLSAGEEDEAQSEPSSIACFLFPCNTHSKLKMASRNILFWYFHKLAPQRLQPLLF